MKFVTQNGKQDKNNLWFYLLQFYILQLLASVKHIFRNQTFQNRIHRFGIIVRRLQRTIEKNI
jgi:hypothetical protein